MTALTSHRWIEQITKQPGVQQRHYNAPLLLERDRYIEYLLRRGSSKAYVRATASYMVRIVHVMNLKRLRMITHGDINMAASIWAQAKCNFRVQKPRKARSVDHFGRVCRGWFSFLGTLKPPEKPWFEGMIETFRSALSIRGIEPRSIERQSWQVRSFLAFLPTGYRLRNLSIKHIDAFISEKVHLGWMPYTVINHCSALRSFFRFAATQGWCEPGFYLGIKNPFKKPRRVGLPAPTWSEVIRLIRSFRNTSAAERRAKAMVMLCAYYGLRSIEVRRIELDDIDWRGAILTVRRGKGHGLQQFPLHNEVGEAIIEYLQKDRPHVSSRLLFVSLRAPYGHIGTMTLWTAVGPRLRKIGSRNDYVGAHCLRHACATRLIHKGASLNQIKDYLGHKHLRSVDVYAHLDARSLRQVAAINIGDLL